MGMDEIDQTLTGAVPPREAESGAVAAFLADLRAAGPATPVDAHLENRHLSMLKAEIAALRGVKVRRPVRRTRRTVSTLIAAAAGAATVGVGMAAAHGGGSPLEAVAPLLPIVSEPAHDASTPKSARIPLTPAVPPPAPSVPAPVVIPTTAWSDDDEPSSAARAKTSRQDADRAHARGRSAQAKPSAAAKKPHKPKAEPPKPRVAAKRAADRHNGGNNAASAGPTSRP